MAIVRPFRGIRPNKEVVDSVISLPYDVVNREEAFEMAKEKPFSFLRICRSEIEFDEEKDPYSKDVYLRAKSNIEKFLSEKVFLKDEEPAIYIYQEEMGENIQRGIVGCVSVDDYKNNIIKKHELTRVEKEQDRINHFDICNANTEPVFLTYRHDDTISEIMSKYVSENEPEYDVIADYNVRHLFWVIREKKVIETIVNKFSSIPSLYIADGHHRSASAYKVGEKRRLEKEDYTGEEEFNYFMAAIFPDNDLNVYGYHRVVKDLNGLTTEEFLHRIKASGFEIEEKGKEEYSPMKKHEFSMFVDNKWYKITAKKNLIKEDVIASLDVSILQDNILDPILDIKDPRRDKRIDFIGGIRGLVELEKRVKSDMKVAFAVYPVDVKDLMDVSDEGKVMPPKSTWFEPKLGSGLFLHQL